MSSFPSSPLLTPKGWKVGAPHHCQMEVEVQDLHMISADNNPVGEGLVPFHWWWKFQLLPHFSQSSRGWWYLIIAWPCWGSRHSTQPWLACVGVGSQFFLCCLAGLEWLLSIKFSILLSYPFPNYLAREGRLLFACAWWHFWFNGFFSSKSGDIWSKNRTKQTRILTIVLISGPWGP